MILASLSWGDGKVNPSGISRVFLTTKGKVKTWPALAAEPATPSAFVNYVGDFELLTSEDKWFQLYSTQGKGHVDFDPIGEKDHKMFVNKFVGKFPDISDEAKAWAKTMLNSNAVLVVEIPTDGVPRYVIIGDQHWDTENTPSGKSGDAAGSEKGLFIEITAPATTPLPTYKGALALTGGTLDCETGVFTPVA